MAIHGHPIHAMTVAFPVAPTFCTFGEDDFYWWTGDAFWARAGVWAVGTAFLFGILGAMSGTIQLLLMSGIRARSAARTHATIAIVLLSLLGANWGYRMTGYEFAILPYGLLLSAFNVIFVSATGWHGGKLGFDYGLGVEKGN